MIPILYAPDEKAFTSNGLGRLTDCRKFEVTEERNGIYEAYFEYPVDGPLFEELKYGYFVYATHDESKTPQAFEIYSKEADMSGWASFRAWHISYQLNDVIVKPFTATSVADAMSKIPANEITPADFTFWTDKLVSGDFTLAIPKAARALLGGSQGSLLDVYGKGDYEFDMYAVKLHTNRGADRGVSIRYGKNLRSLDQKIEGGNIVNGVVPYWESTDGDVVSLDYPIYGGAISFDIPIETHSLEVLQTHVPEDIYAQYVNAKVRTLDLSTVFEEMPTQQQLADYAVQLMSSSTEYELQENLALDFVALWQTEEYKNYASLQRVFLCDTVHIFYEKLGITASAKVIKVIYDTLRERYVGMELGEPKTTLGQQVAQMVTDSVMGEVRGLIKSLPDKSFMDQAIDYATQMIQGGLGGYVVIEPDGDGYPQEILIMDTPDKATAVNVWRFNQGGLGHSSTGYGGPFSDIALTADGKINADMITTGTMQVGRISGLLQDAGQTWSIDFTNGTMVIGDISADNIVAGTIQDVSGLNYWDLTNGQFVTKQGTIGGFNINSTGLHVGNLAVGQEGAAVLPTTFWLVGLAADASGKSVDTQIRAGQFFMDIERNGQMWGGLAFDVHLDNDGYPYAEFRVGESGRITMTLLDHANANNAYDITMASLQVISKLSCLGPVSISGDTTIYSHDLNVAGGGVYATGPVKSNGHFVLEIH